MSKLRQSLAFFLAGLPFLSPRSEAALPPDAPPPEPLDPVKLRPLNLPSENLFAGHRSHSSHASHGSHRSGSGGYAPSPDTYYSPAPAPAPQRVSPGNGAAAGSNNPVDPGRAAAVSPQPAPAASSPKLSLNEKRRLQIMRVQIALTSLGLFTGEVDGVLTQDTKDALKRFQIVKGLPATGLMSTETLNALGVPAVQ